MDVDKVFFGYGHQPEIARDTLNRAASRVADLSMVETLTWEDLTIGGRVVVKKILDAIDEAKVAAFDITTLNPNVLFELGYAIARGRNIWLLHEGSDTQARDRWKQFKLLSGVGEVRWTNSDDIQAAYLRETPHLAETSLYDDLIEPNLTPRIEGSLFLLPSFHATDASKALGRRIDREVRRGVRVVSADPTESALNPLSWYAQKAYETAGTIAHFVADRRDMAWLHNARTALVAGLSRGFERPLLMLGEENYSAPFDYQDELRIYRNADECCAHADSWLRQLILEPEDDMSGRRIKLVTELRGLRFGEHVAENEADLLSAYFVETAAFDDVMASRNTLFLGRKGTGKTANMLQAASRLREDVRNLVVVIKPQAYEMEALVALLGKLPRDVTSYTVMSLWSFLLQTEVARVAALTITSRHPGVPQSDDERKLMQFIEDADFDPMDEFAVRFERTVAALEASGVTNAGSTSQGRDLLNEALHSEAIRVLRSLLGPVLRGRERVAILIDNLDKAWDKRTELEAASHLLLGLLSAVGKVSIDYSKEDFWRDRVELTLATFLRSDIYAYLQRAAREPDKMPTTIVDWRDPDLLLRVIEERFLAARPQGQEARELWEKFFCRTVRGRELKDFLSWRVLPRPRDMVYLCNAATISAVNARRDRVTERDFLNGETIYSQFAFEALLVENGITILELEDVLLEFAGGPAILPREAALDGIRRIMPDGDRAAAVLQRLEAVSFFGLVITGERHVYPEVGPDRKKNEVLARKAGEDSGLGVQVVIHPAYRPYLEVEEPPGT